jgi:hypothetical protein
VKTSINAVTATAPLQGYDIGGLASAKKVDAATPSSLEDAVPRFAGPWCRVEPPPKENIDSDNKGSLSLSLMGIVGLSVCVRDSTGELAYDTVFEGVVGTCGESGQEASPDRNKLFASSSKQSHVPATSVIARNPFSTVNASAGALSSNCAKSSFVSSSKDLRMISSPINFHIELPSPPSLICSTSLIQKSNTISDSGLR